MPTLIIFYITLIGLTFWTHTYIVKRKEWLGVSYFLSIILIIAVLFFGNLVLFLPLNVLSWFTFLSALTGIYFAYKNKVFFGHVKFHPIIYLIPLVILYFSIFGFVKYQPTSWDEYAIWLHRPNIYLFDNAICNFDRAGYFRGYDYTPGLGLLLIFHDFILFNDRFTLVQAIYVTLISSTALYAVLYDTLKVNLAGSSKILIHLILGAFLLYTPIWFPANVLIEPFLFHMYFVFFALFYSYLNGNFYKRKGLFILGIFAFYAFSLKSPSLLFLPAVALVLFYWQERIHWNKDLSFLSIQGKVAIDMLAFLGVVIFAILVWKVSTIGLPPSYKIFTSASLDNWNNRMYLLPKYFSALLNQHTYSSSRTFFVLSGMLGYLLSIHERVKRYFFITITLFFILYFGALVWIYLTAEGPQNAENMPSIGRHINLVLIPYYSFGAFFLFLKLISLREGILNWVLCIKNKVMYCFLGVTVCFYFYGYAALSAHTNYNRMRDLSVDLIKYEARELGEELDKRNSVEPDVLYIYQGMNISVGLRDKYYTFSNTFFKHKIHFDGGTFGPTKKTHWTKVYTAKEMLKRLKAQDIIWINQTDSWIEPLLKKITTNGKCINKWNDYFLFKNNTGTFDCVIKNPTKTNCDVLLKKKNKDSGIFTVDPDGYGPVDPIKVRCKMTDSKGWTLVAVISSKNNLHATDKSVNFDSFTESGNWGKLSDEIINKLAFSGEYKFICGHNNPNKIYLRKTTWRSSQNSIAYSAEYSSDQKVWYKSSQRGVKSWNGFDNYNGAVSNNQPNLFFAYSTGNGGCRHSFNDSMPANGELWVR